MFENLGGRQRLQPQRLGFGNIPVPGTKAGAIVSLGRRFPLGDVCKVEVFGTRDAEECRFLWPPTADDTFFTALRVQAESFAAHAGGRKLEGAGGDDAAAALDAAERAAKLLAAHQAAM